MKHLLETAVIAFPEEHGGRVNAELERLGRLGGEPFEGARKALDDGGFVHFMSLVVAPVLEEECRRRDRSVVVPALEDKCQPRLIIEICADPGEEPAFVRLARTIPEVLRDVLKAMGS